MRYHLQASSFAFAVLELLARKVNMLVKNLWFLCVLVVFFSTIETSPSDDRKVNEETRGKLKLYDYKTKGKKLEFKKLKAVSEKDVGDDYEMKSKPTLRKYKVIRTRLVAKDQHSEGSSRPIVDKADLRVKRNATVLNEFRGSKKGHKKLKLAQAQTGYKNWKNKEHSGDSNVDKYTDKAKKKVSRRHVDYFVEDKADRIRSKRYAVTRSFRDDKSDYYAQRKAVMERFYARQREIVEKYAKKMSSTPKYKDRYDTVTEVDKNNVSATNETETKNERVEKTVDVASQTSTTTETYREIKKATTVNNPEVSVNNIHGMENSLEDNVEEDSSVDYDYYTLEDNRMKQSDAALEDNGALNVADWVADDNRRGTMKWGNCAGKLVYQHNLIIGVHKAEQTDVDVATSIEGPFCIACIRVVPISSTTKVTASFNVTRKEDGSLDSAKLKVTGFRDEELSYVVKMWAVAKRDNC